MAIKVRINTAVIWGTIAQAWYPRRALAYSATTARWWAVYAETFLNNITVAYSDNNGLTWTEEVAVAGLAAFPNLAIVLVVDSTGIPHIIWVDYLVPMGFSNLIQYTNRVGGVWAAPVNLYNAGAANISNVVACIDSADTIHITFQDATSNYMARVGGVWGGLVITTGSYPGAIDINSTLLPHIVSEAGGPINMVRRVGGIWQAPEVISAAGWGESVSFDSSDNLHVAWIDAGGGGDNIIKYRKRTAAGAWLATVDVIDDWDGTGVDALPPILTVDIDGNVYIITQKDNWSGDDTVYYKKITAAGGVGALSIFDAAITRPGGAASCYTGLFHGGSSSSLVAASYHPLAIVLQNNGFDADGYFERQTIAPTVQTNPATEVY